MVDFYQFRKQIIESQQNWQAKTESDQILQQIESETALIANKIDAPENIYDETRNGTRKVSSIIKKFICDKCGRILKRRASFLSHYLVTHLKQIQRKKCPYCPRLFTMSSGCMFMFIYALDNSDLIK